MSLSTVELNHARLSTETSSSFNNMLRKAAEAKVYYLRDTLDPSDIDDVVSQELLRSTSDDKEDASIRNFLHFVKSRISKRLSTFKKH